MSIKKGIKFTESQRNQIYRYIIDLLANLETKSFIVKKIQENYGVSRPQAYHYIDRAMEDLTIRHNEDVSKVRELHKRFLLKQVKGSEGAVKQGWYKLLRELYANELKPEVNNSSTINITYKKAKDE